MTETIVMKGRQDGATLALYQSGLAGGHLPKKALSIRQPWAWLIVNGHKDIENRSWLKRFPPRVLVHAGQALDLPAHRALLAGRHPVNGGHIDPAIVQAYRAVVDHQLPCGGFVGAVDITGVQQDHDSPWFVGDYGYILANPEVLPFLPYRGELGFFKVELP